jgi:hypothetical protein
VGFCKTQGMTKGQIKEREKRTQTLCLRQSRNVPRKEQLSSSIMEKQTCKSLQDERGKSQKTTLVCP